MRRRWKIALGLLGCGAALWVGNTSAFSTPPGGAPRLLAHRGIHQTFSTENLERDTCTAARMNPPTNPFLENTLASMQASFAAGATALELDIQPTTDGEFAVFHDWTLECRTNGRGVTREQSMATLRTLDIGYGYTADNGRTFPFRGRGIGLMPTLGEVLQAFPGRQFLINIKSNDPSEADRLIAYLAARGVAADGHLWVFADGRPRERLAQIAPNVRVMNKSDLKTCSTRYLAMGWTGYVPSACRGGFVAVPSNIAPLFWGWPYRFADRMSAANVEILLTGPVGRGGGIGLDDPDDLSAVPEGYGGIVITDRIEAIGPAIRAGR